MKLLSEFAAEVGRTMSSVRRRAIAEGIDLDWAIAPATGRRVLVLKPAAERALRKFYPAKLEVLK